MLDQIKSGPKGGEFILHLICSSKKYPLRSCHSHPVAFSSCSVLGEWTSWFNIPYRFFFLTLTQSKLLSPCSFCKRGCSTSCVTLGFCLENPFIGRKGWRCTCEGGSSGKFEVLLAGYLWGFLKDACNWHLRFFCKMETLYHLWLVFYGSNKINYVKSR